MGSYLREHDEMQFLKSVWTDDLSRIGKRPPQIRAMYVVRVIQNINQTFAKNAKSRVHKTKSLHISLALVDVSPFRNKEVHVMNQRVLLSSFLIM